jgi:hypothetical protein
VEFDAFTDVHVDDRPVRRALDRPGFRKPVDRLLVRIEADELFEHLTNEVLVHARGVARRVKHRALGGKRRNQRVLGLG